MASLGLKAVLYGVDKVPDKWFEKVPGGYYGGSNGKKKKKQTEAKLQGKEDDRDYRSDGEGRRRRSKRHDYDADDDDTYDERGARRHRARSVGGRDRYDDQGGYDQHRGYNPEQYIPAAAAAGAGVGAASAYDDQNRPISSGPAAGYVPYADIYTPRQTQPPYSSDPRYEQSNVSGRYNEGPADDWNQQYPQSSAAGGAYGQRGYEHDDRQNDRYDDRRNDRYNDRRSDRHGDRSNDRYDERRRDRYHDDRGSDSRSDSEEDDRPRRRRHRKRDEDDTRSRRKSPDPKDNKSRARSSIRDKFDMSEKGLGYGTIGALAGGLIGSEVGKGLWPTVAGAVVGGLGANHFESREKEKESRAKEAAYGSRRDSKRSSRRYESD